MRSGGTWKRLIAIIISFNEHEPHGPGFMVVIAQGEASAAESLGSPRWATLADVKR